MGEYADMHIERYLSGRRGMRIAPPREYPTTTKAAIAGNTFLIVEVTSFKTNRKYGSKLVVCECDPESYWVWASSAVTGIRKDVCTVVESDLTLAAALERTGRKSYKPTAEA
jgi:hypothetical protein